MDSLTESDKIILLQLARQTIERVVAGQARPAIVLKNYSNRLQQDGASFVTLTRSGMLRGCIGALEAYQPLVQDVCEHAEAAALEDYRFSPVMPNEVSLLEIEISVLTPSVSFLYETADDLVNNLRPGIDGVVLHDGARRATFLPQVWEQLPDPEDFLSHLCAKMGSPGDLWRRKKLQVETYQVEEFHE
ncbi:MAG TPA: AmmeMemoRadiSam system protein A [Anaerolineaceae bacterium]|nr:AmmeMemoRadiSam system protein A [Anaerolineaceae bacterium]HQP07544.1 AmmeMemoRadiSam system protein A [Anaerolineaceae bacterium]